MQQIERIEDHTNKSSGKSTYGNEGHTMREMIEGVSKNEAQRVQRTRLKDFKEGRSRRSSSCAYIETDILEE
jgi:hypothetical protein